jgi:hypothetical protein
MKTRQSLPLNQAWVIFFFLGVVMLNYPFLHIFNKSTLIFGVPLFVIYLMVGWPLSILVVYVFSIYLGREPADSEHQDTGPPREGPQ